MRLPTCATLSAFTLAVQATYLRTIDTSAVGVTSEDFIPQCSGCDGSGMWSGSPGLTSTSASARVDLSVFTSVDELHCLNSAVQTFITYAISLTADVKADVLVKAAAISAWSQADIVTLDAALAALIVAKDTEILGTVYFTDATFVGICTKASITATISEEEVACLRAFIATTLTASFDISVSTEAYILNWCRSIVGYSYSQLASLSAQINAAIHAFGPAAVFTRSFTAVSSPKPVRQAIKFVQSFAVKYVVKKLLADPSLVTKAKLDPIMASLNAWVIGSPPTGADSDTCIDILAQLSSCGYDLGLDPTVCGDL